jgi:hypothetical protein
MEKALFSGPSLIKVDLIYLEYTDRYASNRDENCPLKKVIIYR